MTDAVDLWLNENGFGRILRREPVSGGSISEAWRLYLDTGARLFLKQHRPAPENMFQAEAAGLQALDECQGLRVPRVIEAARQFILLEDLGMAGECVDFHEKLGAGLARVHRVTHPRFGFPMDNYCGSTPQCNTLNEDGFEFFANCRILQLAAPAFDRGLLERKELHRLERIAAGLRRWIPEQPAVLIHGDLWRGNVHCDGAGNPALIDPAVYWGWAEAELAMTRLFGGFDERFYGSYEEHAAVARDWPEREPLYNLYHLLNHLLLFGGAWLEPIRRICARFG